MFAVDFESYHLLQCITFLLCVAATLLSAISLATPSWKLSMSAGTEYGIFESCKIRSSKEDCQLYTNVPDYINATRAFVILGVVGIVFGVFLSLIHALGKMKKKGHVVLGIVLLLSCVFFLVGCSVYTAKTRENLLVGEEFGYSLWMAWAACIISFIAAPVGFLSKYGNYGYMS
ncbi:claudin-4-like isoform X1 [Styela clava]|uniref:uncharacterized protein LOC120328377 isoform X1 n=1 Tax=Styela clava TaxID=7725 RepID=UPI00193ADFBD|nr:uncharacterized protein LOC120328377 isoform X1 [Styela clava]